MNSNNVQQNITKINFRIWQWDEHLFPLSTEALEHIYCKL